MNKIATDSSTRTMAQIYSEEGLETSPLPPTEGIRAISAICARASEMTSEFLRSSQSGLGSIVVGNNAVMPPPAQRISGMNGAALAGLAAAIVGVAKAADGDESPAISDDSESLSEDAVVEDAEEAEPAVEAAEASSESSSESSGSEGESE